MVKLNRGVLFGVVAMVVALGATGCNKLGDAGSVDEGSQATASRAGDGDTAASDEATTMFASAERRFDWAHRWRPEHGWFGRWGGHRGERGGRGRGRGNGRFHRR